MSPTAPFLSRKRNGGKSAHRGCAPVVPPLGCVNTSRLVTSQPPRHRQTIRCPSPARCRSAAESGGSFRRVAPPYSNEDAPHPSKAPSPSRQEPPFGRLRFVRPPAGGCDEGAGTASAVTGGEMRRASLPTQGGYHPLPRKKRGGQFARPASGSHDYRRPPPPRRLLRFSFIWSSDSLLSEAAINCLS